MLYDWQTRKVLATQPLLGTQESDDIWPKFAAHCCELFPYACIEVYTAENCHVISPGANDDPRLPHEYYCVEDSLLDWLLRKFALSENMKSGSKEP